MYEICAFSSINASGQHIFDTITDHERFIRGPYLTCRLVREGLKNKNGLGAMREITTKGNVFTEEITAFDPPEHYEYVVRQLVDRRGKPVRFRHERGWLDVKPHPKGAMCFDWHSRFEIPIPILGRFAERWVGWRAHRQFRRLIDQAREDIHAREADQSARVDSFQRIPDSLPQTTNVRYQGRTADQWAAELFGGNDSVSQRAGFAMNQIGAESLRFFYDGMLSKWLHIRFNSVNLLPYKAAAQHADVFVPILRLLLKEPEADIQQFAAFAMLHCEFKEGLPAMREAFRSEPETTTKADIKQYIEDLEKK